MQGVTFNMTACDAELFTSATQDVAYNICFKMRAT